MPCYEPPDTDMETQAGTAMNALCKYLTRIEGEGQPIPEEFREWWEKHKRFDAERARINWGKHR